MTLASFFSRAGWFESTWLETPKTGFLVMRLIKKQTSFLCYRAVDDPPFEIRPRPVDIEERAPSQRTRPRANHVFGAQPKQQVSCQLCHTRKHINRCSVK